MQNNQNLAELERKLADLRNQEGSEKVIEQKFSSSIPEPAASSFVDDQGTKERSSSDKLFFVAFVVFVFSLMALVSKLFGNYITGVDFNFPFLN